MNLVTLNTHEITMTAALGRAKDGEGRASQVEPIFGDLIDSLEHSVRERMISPSRAARELLDLYQF